MPYILWGDEFKPQYVVAVKNLEPGRLGICQDGSSRLVQSDKQVFAAHKLLYSELWAC